MKVNTFKSVSVFLPILLSNAEIIRASSASGLQKRSLPASPPASQSPTTNSSDHSIKTTVNDTECQKLPISIQTWNSLKIDDHMKNVTLSQNLTLAKYASMNGAGNFICGIGEECNVGQLCHPVKTPSWQVLFASQEYNNFVNRMVNSINYAFSQAQSISASMANDLFPKITDSRFLLNLEWIFTDMYRGIAYGATALFLITWLNLSFISGAINILISTVVGAGIAAWIMGEPKGVTFSDWAELSFYIAQAQQSLTGHIEKEMTRTLKEPLSMDHGLFKTLQGGTFFQESLRSKPMDIMEDKILRTFQGRLMARMLRQQNAYVTIAESNCNPDVSPIASKGGDSQLFYCDPKENLFYKVVLAHKKKTINEIHGANEIINKYNFTAEEIVKSSWDCQRKYKKFEHDPFANFNGTIPVEAMNEDCIFNLPVCDQRLEAIRVLKFGKHKTTTVACRKGGGLPI